MELTLQILLGLVAVICFVAGANVFIKGANYFLPDNVPQQIVLDNVFRFLSGIFFGMGFLFTWTTIHLSQIGELIYFLGIVVIFSGLGRLYSRTKVGSGGKYLDFVMWFEILLGLGLIILEYLRS